MKHSKFYILFIVLQFSNLLFSQGILHPQRFGIGYHLGIAVLKGESSTAHAVSLSPNGDLDFILSFDKKSNIGLGFDYFIGNRVDKDIIPAISISGTITDEATIGQVGGALYFKAYNHGIASIIPAVGLSGAFELGSTNDSDTEIVFAANVGFAMHLGKTVIINMAPGLSIVQDMTIFIFSAGFILTPF